jgi:cytochrome P450
MTTSINGTELVEPLELNVWRPEFRDNPRPVYHALRSRDPVSWSDLAPPGTWLVTGYRQATAILRDPRFGKQGYVDGLAITRGGENGAWIRIMRSWMSNLDPPEHTAVRRVLAKPFSRRSVNALRPRIERIATELLSAIPADSAVDLMSTFALPLPMTMICGLLGVADTDQQLFKSWLDRLDRLSDPFVDPATVDDANAAVLEFSDYFTSRFRQMRMQPESSDLLSTFAAVCHSQADAIGNAILLMSAGHATTMFLIGNAVLSLLDHPDQLALLRARPELVEPCIEEVLRYEGSIQVTRRIALEDVEIGDHTIRRDQHATILNAAVNCDPARYEDPDRFDIARRLRGHVAFGGGAHTCLGAALAKLEAAVAISSLLDAYPRIERVDEPIEWTERLFFRGPTRLMLRCGT